MKFAQFFVIALSLAIASSTKLECKFELVPGLVEGYRCSGVATTSRNDYLIDEVTGTHIDGGSNDIVEIVTFDGPMEVVPRNLISFFRRYNVLEISNNDKLKNFKRSDFYDFTGLDIFRAVNIASVTTIPRDTFFDMKLLQRLTLDQMPNMENLHEDLLIHLRGLQVFSVKGPNKIDSISPGFFRGQSQVIGLLVDFSDTKLVRVGHSVFTALKFPSMGIFQNSGCINTASSIPTLCDEVTKIVREHCEDVLSPEEAEVQRFNMKQIREGY